jgi:S1-C subfamily serine protease
MRLFAASILGTAVLFVASAAESPRFVVDDDAYVDRVTTASAKLLKHNKLNSAHSLRNQVHTRDYPLKLTSLVHQRLSTTEMYEHLRQSTLAVGSFYKCPDCGEWHFNSSAGFVVGEGGVICTCCHVVQAEDKGVQESYLVAADSTGHVYPVQSVLAADTESDTCLLKIDAAGLKPLGLRPGVSPGERVFCLSHPGGYFFMFSQGMVARVNIRRNEVVDEHGQTNGLLTRPIVCLNVTTEFAPGSSGAPVVDEEGNVVGQVASIADAGEPPIGETNAPPSPSVPVRFCTATEEILRLMKRHSERTNQIVRAPARSIHAATGSPR